MCVFRHLLQILVTSNSQKKKSQQPPGAAHLTLLDHLSKGEFFPMFTNPDPNTNQFLGFAQGGFCSKKKSKNLPQTVFEWWFYIIATKLWKKSPNKKTHQKSKFFLTTSLSSIPSYPSSFCQVRSHLPNSPQLYFLAPPGVARPPAPRIATLATPFWKVWARPLVAKHKRLISTSGEQG